MSTSRRGRHVEIAPSEEEASTGVEDVDGFKVDVIPLLDDEDSDPLASIDQQVSPSCHSPTTTTGKTLPGCVWRRDMKFF
jgi:hypothetical protein